MPNEVKLLHEKFKSFERSKECLDEFFLSTCEVPKNYEELSVIKIILVLSHGQSAVEHSFSLGKSFIEENISKESIRNKVPAPFKLLRRCKQITNVLGLNMKYTWNKKKNKKSKLKTVTKNPSQVKKLME